MQRTAWIESALEMWRPTQALGRSLVGWRWAWWPLCLVLVGLILTAWGAYVAAVAVIINDQIAEAIATTYWRLNEELRTSLIQQSQSARCGLLLIVGGTAVQFVGTVAQSLLRRQ